MERWPSVQPSSSRGEVLRDQPCMISECESRTTSLDCGTESTLQRDWQDEAGLRSYWACGDRFVSSHHGELLVWWNWVLRQRSSRRAAWITTILDPDHVWVRVVPLVVVRLHQSRGVKPPVPPTRRWWTARGLFAVSPAPRSLTEGQQHPVCQALVKRLRGRSVTTLQRELPIPRNYRS